MRTDELSQLLQSVLAESPEYNEAIEILNRNATGKRWLIGGFVYRNLAMKLYGTEPPEIDLDFIVEHVSQSPNLPDGWRVERNRFGNPKYIREGLSLDIIPLTNIHSITANNLPSKIESFLAGTPLTIQSIAFELDTQKLVGEAGIEALRTQMVAVHNQEALDHVAQKYNRTTKSYVLEKAQSLGFSVFMPTSA